MRRSTALALMPPLSVLLFCCTALLVLLLLLDSVGGVQASVSREDDARVQGSIITAPRRQRIGGCKRGQLLDRRGRCRTPY